MPQSLAKKNATRQAPPVTDTPPARLAAIYIRVSTKEQADRGYSLPMQLEACQAYAAQHGYVVPPEHLFTDDYTGMSLTRPAFSCLRALIESQAIEALIVHDLDRLSRKLAHQLLLEEELARLAVTLCVVLMPETSDTPESHLLTNMRGIIAEYERAKILERTARGRRGRMKAGNVPHGRATFGYRYVTQDNRSFYAIDPDGAALVRRIFDLYVHHGYALTALARLLTTEGVPLPAEHVRKLSARVWHRSTIYNILCNETYIGVAHDNKTQRIAGKSNPDRHTRRRLVPRDEWIAVAVPPLIEPALFEAAQAQMARNKIHSTRNRKHDYLLVDGRLRCGQCGLVMSGRLDGRGYAMYRCSRPAYADVVTPHTRRCVQARQLEHLVWSRVEQTLNEPERIAAEVAKQAGDATTRLAALATEQTHYQKQLGECDRLLTRWEVAYASEAIDLDDFKAKKADLAVRRASLAQELAALEGRRREVAEAAHDTAALVDYCRRVRANLRDFTLDEKHRALEALGVAVVWHPDREPEITGSIPLPTASTPSRWSGQNYTFRLVA